MTAQVIEVGGRRAIRAGLPARVPAPTSRLLIDAIRRLLAVVLMVLALAGLAGTGILVGAGATHPTVPAPGFAE